MNEQKDFQFQRNDRHTPLLKYLHLFKMYVLNRLKSDPIKPMKYILYLTANSILSDAPCNKIIDLL